MKNITVAVKDEVYHHARRAAAERKTSVSRLVTAYLQSLGTEEDRLLRAKARFEELLRQPRKFVVGKPDTREERNAR